MAEQSSNQATYDAVLTQAQRLALTLAAPAVRVGYSVFESDTGNAYVVGVAAGSVQSHPTLVWVLVGSSGPPVDAGWSKYVVSKQATPVALYSTIPAAIAAAVLDGHGGTNATGAVVLVMPGVYPEAFALRSGVAVVGLGATDIPGDAVITANVTTQNEAGAFLLKNVAVTPDAGAPVTFGGSAAAVLRIDDCVLTTSGAPALRVSNSGGSTVAVRRSTLVGGIEAFATLYVDNAIAGGVTLDDTTVTATNAQTIKAVDSAAAFAAARSQFAGQVRGTSAAVTLSYSSVAATEQPCLFASGGAPIAASYVALAHTQVSAFDPAVHGAGGATWVPRFVQFTANALLGAVTPAPTGVASFGAGQRVFARATAVSYVQVPADYEIAVTSTAAPRAITLLDPAASGGTPQMLAVLVVKDQSGGAGTNNITITPAAGTIDGAASVVISQNYGAVSLYCNGTAWFTNSAAAAAPNTVGDGTGAVTYRGGANVTRRGLVGGDFPYAALATDYYLGVTTTAAPRAITLPGAATSGRVYIVKDESGGAAANNITVTPASGTIDGAANKVLNVNFQSQGFISNGTNWFLL